MKLFGHFDSGVNSISCTGSWGSKKYEEPLGKES